MGSRRRKKALDRRSPGAVIRQLDPSDQRSLDHPCHKEQWLELARALGSALERHDWERLRSKGVKRGGPDAE
jgi:hypothetical protein